MGHAKRDDSASPPRGPHFGKGAPRPPHVGKGPVLARHAVEQILDPHPQQHEGDPVAGIRNAVLIGIAVWMALAVALAYIR